MKVKFYLIKLNKSKVLKDIHTFNTPYYNYFYNNKN